MEKMKLISLTLLCITFFGSCISTEKCENGETGTFKNLEGLDGCGWIIELENGDRLQPINFEGYQIKPEEGLQVSFSYSVSESMSGICMTGKIVELSCLKVK